MKTPNSDAARKLFCCDLYCPVGSRARKCPRTKQKRIKYWLSRDSSLGPLVEKPVSRKLFVSLSLKWVQVWFRLSETWWYQPGTLSCRHR